MTPEELEKIQEENLNLKCELDAMNERVRSLEKENARMRQTANEANDAYQKINQELIFLQGKIQAYEFVFRGGKNNG